MKIEKVKMPVLKPAYIAALLPTGLQLIMQALCCGSS